MNEIQDYLDSYFEGKKQVQVLEAGCGSASRIMFKKGAYITGIDISSKQLARNRSLNDAILGDIQTHKLRTSFYDVIICWDVLEHLKRPDLALLNFFCAIKPGGIIILALPNLFSIKGLFTKYSPLWIHTIFYKYVLGRREAGKEDTGPFKAYLRFSVAPKALMRFAKKHGLTIVYFKAHDMSKRQYWRKKSRIARHLIMAYSVFMKIGKFISANSLGESDFIIALKKPDS